MDEILVVDMKDNNSRFLCRTPASSAIMNPDSKIVALETGRNLQISNIETQTRIKCETMPEEVMFWKWISPNTVGIVTKSAVYHWSQHGASGPQKMCRRSSRAGAQIVDYQTDSKQKWLLVVTLHKHPEMSVVCSAQTFAEIQLEGNIEPNLVLCYAFRNAAVGKLHMVDVDDGVNPTGKRPFTRKAVDLTFQDYERNDYPFSVHASHMFDVIFVITRNGYISIYHIDSAVCIYMCKLCSDPILATTLGRGTGGVSVIDKKGKVISFTIVADTIVPYLAQKLKDSNLAVMKSKLARTEGLLPPVTKQLEPKKQATVTLTTLRNKSGRLTWKGFPGKNGGSTGMKADQLYYCSQNSDNCGCEDKRCNVICGPSDGCPCSPCLDLSFEQLLLSASPNPTPSAPYFKHAVAPELPNTSDLAQAENQNCIIC